MTPLGLLRSTRNLQGATDLVAHFCRVVFGELESMVVGEASVYLNNIGKEGARRPQGNEELDKIPSD